MFVRSPQILGIFLCGFTPWASVRAAQPLTPQERQEYDALEARPLQEFNNVDLEAYLRLRNKDFAAKEVIASPAEDMRHYALKALRQRYRLSANRFDLSESDCVVFVERTLALALSSDWDMYYRLCQRLRHKNGAVSFLERNFFTLADWVPNNAWLLEDITEELGPTEEFKDVVHRKAFLENLEFGVDDSPAGRAKGQAKAAKVAAAPAEEIGVHRYTPRVAMPDVMDRLRTGDIALVIRHRDKPGRERWLGQGADRKRWLDCDHMGIVVRDEGGAVFLVHSAPGVVGRETLQSFLRRFPFVEGFKFLRLREDAREKVDAVVRATDPQLKAPAPETLDDQIRATAAGR